MGLLDRAGSLAVKSELSPPVPVNEDVVESIAQSAVEGEVAFFHRMHLDFECLVLDGSAADGADKDAAGGDFCETVSAIIDKAGTVIPLTQGMTQGFPLILLPAALDRELIAHRLSKTLSAKVLLSFSADSAESAIRQLNSLS